MRQIFALVMILVIAGCGKEKADYTNINDKDNVANGGVYIQVSTGDASNLLPFLVGDSASTRISNRIFSGLTRYDENLKQVGELAKSWEFTNGGKTLTFKLRKGVLWSDGKPLTAADVKYTWELIMDENTPSPHKDSFDLITSMEIPDPLTIIMHYKKPYARAIEAWGMGIVPKHLLEKEKKEIMKSKYNRAPVGTGPFKFKKWVDKQFIELEANDLWFKGRPHLDRFVVKIIPEPATQLLELKADQIDRMGLTSDQYKSETSGKDFKKIANKYRFPGMSSYTYVGFNLSRKPFDDKRVRRALSHAIDRQAIIDGIVLGYGKPCSGPYSPLVPAYNKKVKPMAYDLEKAKALLTEAGWIPGKDGIREKNGKRFKFKLITNSGNTTREKIVVMLQQQFKKIGVEAEVQTYEWSTYISNYVDEKNFDALVIGWNLTLDPDLYSIFHSSQTGKNQYNFGSYKNAEVDRLLEKGRTMVDMKKRIPIYREVHRLIAEDQPYAFLYAPDELSALHKRFQGLRVTDIGYTDEWEHRWYVPASVQRRF